jgi:hypothetical protein
MRFLISLLVVLAVGLSIGHSQTRAPLKITVDKDQKTTQEVKRQAEAFQTGSGVVVHTPQVTERSRAIVMNIKVQNLGGSTMTGLVVKYTLFGKDRNTRAVRPVGKGEGTISLKPLESKVVKTEAVEFESADLAFTRGYGAELNRTAGRDYYGIAVAVFVGEDKVATYFNPPGTQKELEKLDQDSVSPN